MVHFVLALILLLTAGFGILSARGLLQLRKAVSAPIALGTAVGYALVLFLQPELPWVPNISILLAGSSFGFLLGHLLGSTGSVLTFLCTAALVDLFSFSDGLTKQIVEAYQSGGSIVLRFLAFFVELGGQEYAVIGVSDIAVVAAAYLGLQKATGLNWEPALFLLASLLAAFIVGMLLGGAPGIPFLAGGAAAFALLHRQRQSRDLDRSR
jgi:hypothetical protein